MTAWLITAVIAVACAGPVAGPQTAWNCAAGVSGGDVGAADHFGARCVAIRVAERGSLALSGASGGERAPRER